MIQKVHSNTAPAAIGPYSQAMKCANMVYTSGQLGLNPATGELPADLKEQAHYSLSHVKSVLEAAGSRMDKVMKTTVFITDMAHFPIVNEVYAQYFQEPFPARSCVAVAALPKGALVEVEAVAVCCNII